MAASVGFSAPAYTLDESVGTTTDQIRLTVRTNPDTPVPRDLTVPVRTRDGTAASGDDYSESVGRGHVPAAVDHRGDFRRPGLLG